MSVCSICLDTIHDEAYLDGCFHCFCFECILRWAHTQLNAQAEKREPPSCPLCKAVYTSIVHDFKQTSFKRLYVSTDGIFGYVCSDSGFQLSPAHLKRRSVYIAQLAGEGARHLPGATRPDICIAVSSTAWKQQASARSRLSVRPAPAALRASWLRTWLKRDLQAIMQEEDVDMIVQHVAAYVEHLQMRGKVVGSSEWLHIMAETVQPFIFEHADTFAAELALFLSTGLDMAAYDRLCLSDATKIQVSSTQPLNSQPSQS
eukprot:jgi/Chlat1/5263/Chrsp33S05092